MAWPWLAFALLVGGAAGAILWLRRRIGPTGPVTVPQIERPRVPAAEPEPPPEHALRTPAPLPAPGSRPAGTATALHPLRISIQPRKLALTMMNATLSYRLTLTNGGKEALEDIVVAADLIGAHSSLPREAQLAGPATELPERQRMPALGPGESRDVTGDLRLPLSQVRPIVRGKAAMLVPLARFRVAAPGQDPRCFTLVVGQPSPRGDGIQPVRLDLGPRNYDGLAGRAF